MPKTPDDILFALREADKPAGFTPSAKSTALLLSVLESGRYLVRSEVYPVWTITPAGRRVLNGAELTADDITAIDALRRAVG